MVTALAILAGTLVAIIVLPIVLMYLLWLSWLLLCCVEIAFDWLETAVRRLRHD